MANFDILEPPELSLELRKLEPEDRAHADVFNELYDTLINNDAYLDKGLGQAKNDITLTGSVSGSGSVTVPDALENTVLDMIIKGKSVQETTKGINMLDMYSAKGGTSGGITSVVNLDGTYTSSGDNGTEGTVNIWFLGAWYQDPETKPVFLVLEPGETYYTNDVVLYTMVGPTDPKGISPGIHRIDPVLYPKGVKITGIRHAEVKGAINNKTYYPIVVKSSVAVPWEPYTGGKPAPNPNYPQEVKNVIDPVLVSSIGKRNLLTETNNGDKNWVVSSAAGEGGIFSLKSHMQNDINAVKLICENPSTSWHFLLYKTTDDLKKLKPNTNYSLSFNIISSTEISNLRFNIQTMGGINSLLRKQVTWQLEGGGKKQKIELTFMTNDLTGGVKDQVIYFADFNKIGEYILWDLKLEEGSEVTPWTPALEDITDENKEQYLPYLNKVDLAGYSLYGIEEVKDRVLCQNQIWGIERKTGIIDNDSWIITSVREETTGHRYRAALTDIQVKADTRVYCSKYTQRTGIYSYDVVGDYIATEEIPTTERIHIRTQEKDFSSTAAFKMWMSDAVTLYILAEPTWEPFPVEIQKQLNELYIYSGEYSTVYVVSEVESDVEVEYFRKVPIVESLLPMIDQKISNSLVSGRSTITVTLLKEGWVSSDDKYIQTITAEGVNESMEPLLVKALEHGASETDRQKYKMAFSIISDGYAETQNGSVTFVVYELPAITLTVGLKGA